MRFVARCDQEATRVADVVSCTSRRFIGITGPMETERASPRYSDIDVWDPSDILDAMIEGQFTAVAAVRSARPAIERAARAIEARLKQGGRLIYAGAGTSGR